MAALTFPTPTQLKNIGDPTANTDAATKQYVDAQIGSANVGYANTAGTVVANAQPNITSVGNLTSLVVTGNITAGNVNGGNLVIANYFSGDGSALTGIIASSAANSNYANYAGTAFNVSGSNVSGQVGNALVAGTVYTNAQPNITSVGSLTGLTVTGNVTLSGANVNLGSVSNLSISGGNANYVLQTDGSGALSWAEQSGGGISSQTNDFTGDGTTTAYTLSSTPTDANYTFVSVAGLFEPRTTYTVSGNVITFSEAPPSGSPIEVTVLGSGTGGGGGGGGGITAQDLLSPFLLMGA